MSGKGWPLHSSRQACGKGIMLGGAVRVLRHWIEMNEAGWMLTHLWANAAARASSLSSGPPAMNMGHVLELTSNECEEAILRCG